MASTSRRVASLCPEPVAPPRRTVAARSLAGPCVESCILVSTVGHSAAAPETGPWLASAGRPQPPRYPSAVNEAKAALIALSFASAACLTFGSLWNLSGCHTFTSVLYAAFTSSRLAPSASPNSCSASQCAHSASPSLIALPHTQVRMVVNQLRCSVLFSRRPEYRRSPRGATPGSAAIPHNRPQLHNTPRARNRFPGLSPTGRRRDRISCVPIRRPQVFCEIL